MGRHTIGATPSSNVQGMCVFHKPTERDTWQERKSALNGRRGKKGEKEKLRLLLPLLHTLQLPSHP